MAFTMIHENYNVSNLDVSISFYEKALGLHEVRRKNAADGSFVIVYMADDTETFELELPRPIFIAEVLFELDGINSPEGRCEAVKSDSPKIFPADASLDSSPCPPDAEPNEKFTCTVAFSSSRF
mgnify:FL=1